MAVVSIVERILTRCPADNSDAVEGVEEIEEDPEVETLVEAVAIAQAVVETGEGLVAAATVAVQEGTMAAVVVRAEVGLQELVRLFRLLRVEVHHLEVAPGASSLAQLLHQILPSRRQRTHW